MHHILDNHIIEQSHKIYNGTSGLQDYGIIGQKIKSKLIDVWKYHFLFNDEIDEVETPILMPYTALKASGHVDRFIDYVVYDSNNKCYRADHLIKNHNTNDELNIDNMTKEEMEKYIKNNLSEQLNLEPEKIFIKEKNLMYHHEDENLYLRPELAQGIFINFKKYYEYNKTLPFAISQVGQSFRREISPQQYTRMRSFWQAEIEHFFDPKLPFHEKFISLSHITVPLVTEDNQEITTSLYNAYLNKIIKNQIICYYIGKIYQFSQLIGLKKDLIRFRQHNKNELSHYSSECWDLECFVDNKWLECVGCANRQDYDLKCHKLAVSRETKVIRAKPQMKEIGKIFKSRGKNICEYLNKLNNDQCVKLQNELLKNDVVIVNIDDTNYEINKNYVSFDEVSDSFYPHVVEPSFGIDRLMYALINQNTWKRESIDYDNKYVVSLPKTISPFNCAILQLTNDKNILNFVQKIKNNLCKNGFSCYVDTTGTSIGKRYVRCDQIGIKYVVTVDYDSLEDKKVTIRERDNMSQIRVDIDEVDKYL